MNGEQSLQQWHEYYVLGGTAAATLLGLLFIAVTLNGDLILAGARPHTRHAAEQAFQNYIAVLVTALLLVFPGFGLRPLAVSILGEAAVMISWVVFRMTKTRLASDTDFGRSRVWRRLLPSMLAYGMMMLGGSQLVRSSEPSSARRLVGFATLLLLISATATSWDL